MRTRHFLLSAVLVTACGDRNAPSTERFGQVIQSALTNVQACTRLDANWVETPYGPVIGHLPVDAMQDPSFRSLKGLAKYGLIRYQEGDAETPTVLGTVKERALIVSITDKGAQLLKEGRGSWCFGHKILTKVNRYTKPGVDAAGRTVSLVEYSYHIKGMADWARDPDVRAGGQLDAFRFKPEMWDGELPAKVVLVRTSDGWAVAGPIR